MAQVTCRRLTSWWQMPQWLIWLFLWLATVALLIIISCLLGAIETSSIFMLLCFLGGWYFHWVLILSSLNLRLMIFFLLSKMSLYHFWEWSQQFVLPQTVVGHRGMVGGRLIRQRNNGQTRSKSRILPFQSATACPESPTLYLLAIGFRWPGSD